MLVGDLPPFSCAGFARWCELANTTLQTWEATVIILR